VLALVEGKSMVGTTSTIQDVSVLYSTFTLKSDKTVFSATSSAPVTGLISTPLGIPE
jgi:hypothetical protein